MRWDNNEIVKKLFKEKKSWSYVGLTFSVSSSHWLTFYLLHKRKRSTLLRYTMMTGYLEASFRPVIANEKKKIYLFNMTCEKL